MSIFKFNQFFSRGRRLKSIVSENRLGLRKFFTEHLLLVAYFRTFGHHFYCSPIIRTLTMGNFRQNFEYRFFSKTGSRIDSKFYHGLKDPHTNYLPKKIFNISYGSLVIAFLKLSVEEKENANEEESCRPIKVGHSRDR